jgi:hypothetical protein
MLIFAEPRMVGVFLIAVSSGAVAIGLSPTLARLALRVPRLRSALFILCLLSIFGAAIGLGFWAVTWVEHAVNATTLSGLMLGWVMSMLISTLAATVGRTIYAVTENGPGWECIQCGGTSSRSRFCVACATSQ